MKDINIPNNNASGVTHVPTCRNGLVSRPTIYGRPDPSAFTHHQTKEAKKLELAGRSSHLANVACSSAMMVPALLLCLFFSFHHQATADGPSGHVRCQSTECPKFTVVDVDDARKFEVREYESPLWVFAKHHHPCTSYPEALSKQATTLSSYLNGNNDFNTTISETAPVLTIVIPGLYHAGAPFGDAYRFARYLPQKYQLTVPPPSNTTVRFWRFPPENHYVVVKKFRGGANNGTSIDHAMVSARESLKGSPWEKRVRPYGGFAVANYNYPDTTNNEIWLLAEKEWISVRGL